MTQESAPGKESLSKLSVGLAGLQLENASRGHDIKEVFIDVCERDDALNILVYVKPGVPKIIVNERIRPALIMACKVIFGPKPKPGCFDLIFRDNKKVSDALRNSRGGGIKLEVDGVFDNFDVFDIAINPPESMFHSVESLRKNFLPAFNGAMIRCGNL